MGQNEKPEDKTSPQRIVIVTSAAPTSIDVQAGEMKTITLLSVFLLENNPDVSPNVTMDAALSIFEHASNDVSKLRSEHESAWNELWSRGGVEIESSSSNLATQVNSSFYYMLSSVREDVAGVGPVDFKRMDTRELLLGTSFSISSHVLKHTHSNTGQRLVGYAFTSTVLA